MNNNCLSNKDLKKIAKMLEKLKETMLLRMAEGSENNSPLYQYANTYVNSILNNNYNYSNILNYLNNAIPLIDDMLDQPKDKVSLPISYETH